MKVRALRGVCIGVDRHLQPDDVVDLEAAQVTFLKGIGAVEVVPDDTPATPEATTNAKPGRSAKAATARKEK